MMSTIAIRLRSPALGAAVAIGMVLGACHTGPVFVAEPVTTPEVDVRLVDWDLDRESLSVELRFFNKTQESIFVDENLVAVVWPDGTVSYEGVGEDFEQLRPLEVKDVDIGVDSPRFNPRKLEGVHLRFEGVYSRQGRIHLPSMALGKPKHPPGPNTDYPIPKRFQPEAQEAVKPEEAAVAQTTILLLPVQVANDSMRAAAQVFTGAVAEQIEAQHLGRVVKVAAEGAQLGHRDGHALSCVEVSCLVSFGAIFGTERVIVVAMGEDGVSFDVTVVAVADPSLVNQSSHRFAAGSATDEMAKRLVASVPR